MAYTTADQVSVKAAILALATGTRAVRVNLSNGASIQYGEADLAQLRTLLSEIRAEVQASSGRKRHYLMQTSKGL